ncbi:MAG TPA: hypothetical protein VIK84_02630 [Haloplasmataceae bacterium]
MEVFTIKDNKVIINPDVLSIPQFREIWDRDKSSAKEIAEKELAYVYHMCAYKSVYRNYPEDIQEYKIKEDYFKNTKWEPDSIILKAVEKFKELSDTHSMRFLNAAITACNKLIKYYHGIDFSERDNKGNAVYKVNEVTTALEKSGKIIQSLELLKEKVEKELAINNTKVRGGGTINKREE